MNWKISFIAFNTILTKEVVRVLRIWLQTILPPAITMSLYFIIFGNLIGPRIGNMGNFSYIDFIVPGLIMMSVITNSYTNVASSFFSAKFQKSVEEILVAPVPSSMLILGYVGGGMFRGIVVGVVVTLVSLFFTSLKVHSVGTLVVVVFLTSLVFSLGGYLNAIFAKKFDDVSIVPTFILTPLTYLGGVFYSIRMLPEFWQQVSLANPILYMVNAFRYGFLGVSDIETTHGFLMLIAFACVLFCVNLYLTHTGKGIRQ